MEYSKKITLQSAIAAIMSRNMSHNLGSHVVTNAKHQIEDLEKRQDDDTVKKQLKGLSALLQYLQERQDFIAVIANDEHYPKGPLNFKSAVFDILAMDGPPERHGIDTKINNYILDNIVRSENVTRRGSLSGDANADSIGIELQLVKEIDGKMKPFPSFESHGIGSEFADVTLSVNNGLNGRQALLTVLENIIRNAAKHDKEALFKLDTLLFSIIFRERKDAATGTDFFEITIADNKRNFGALKRKFEKPSGNNTPFIKDGKLAPLQILREDGGGIAKDNKGLKEILISLTWLKYGERGKSGNVEIDYDTLQNAPWEILDVVGVDEHFAVYDFDAPNQPSDLSLGYRFRLDKYKNVHLLSRDEIDSGRKSLKELLADLPGASLYAVKESDYNRAPENKVLHAITRLEIVPDRETEASLQGQFETLLERNVKRRFETDALPRLRISENYAPSYDDWDRQAVIRDTFGDTADENWKRNYSDEEFIHYRTHYETVLDNATDAAGLNLEENAVFTEGISGGNFTNNLIRTAIARDVYLGIVEAALAQIAIVDERIFAKCAGRSPGHRQANPNEADKPLWKYLEQKGIHILNSDENGIFDLRGYYISTGIHASVEYDFLSIHLGLIDKTNAGENSSEAQRLSKVLEQFGARYIFEKTKISIHSGRGGMTQVEDIAFVPLSGIEWALDNCKYTLSEFFHGIKYPPFGEATKREPRPGREKKRNRKIEPATAPIRNVPTVASRGQSVTKTSLPSGARSRPVFLFTTYAIGTAHLYGTASEMLENPGIEKFVSLEAIQAKTPRLVEHFKSIAHIDSRIFFYPCTKPDNRVLIPQERHGEFVSQLVGRILEAVPGNEAAELHLILHASDALHRRHPNTKDSEHPLIEQIKQAYPERVSDATIWWFSHDGTGIHKNIVCNERLFEGVNDKTSHLLGKLAAHTNTPLLDTSTRTAATRTVVAAAPSALRRQSVPSSDERDVCCVLTIPDEFQLNNKTYLNRLATWQLSGANQQDALNHLLNTSGNNDAFWSPEFSPERCAGRLTNPKPLLVIASKPLGEFGEEERRANYIDSSIWCRYARSEQEAADIRKQFVRYRDLGLYHCNNGLEYLEFWARMLINSRFGEFGSSSHGKISPLVFHSEGEMAKKTAESVKEILGLFEKHPLSSRPLIWKILLVDDHSRENLSRGNHSKLDVICDALSSLFSIEISRDGKCTPYQSESSPALNGLYQLKIHCATTIEEATDLIQEQHFDIVLLDYLLNKDKTVSPMGRDFNTSDELLEEIRKSTRDALRGPMGYLWIFNVSAFASAIDGKLTAKGLQYHTNEWHLNKGACPINTPELFKYNLLSFMRWQVDELVKFHRKRMLREHKDPRSLVGLLRKIYMPEGRTPRQMADLYFRGILNFESDCKIMREDILFGLSGKETENVQLIHENPKKSELVFSLFPDIVHYNNAFWDHLSHLVHLTAYGSPQQWPHLLVSFREVKKTLLVANEGPRKQAAMELIQKIEEYIIDLHN